MARALGARVYPSGTKRVEEEAKPLGVVAISAVRAVTSEAKVVAETEPGATEFRFSLPLDGDE